MNLLQKHVQPLAAAAEQALPAAERHQVSSSESVTPTPRPVAPGPARRAGLHPLIALMAVAVTAVSALGGWAIWRNATTEPPPPPPIALCVLCGVVESVSSYEVRGEASGLGAVAGAGAGGVVGNQMGKGNGKKALTVLGAVGGAFAGHEAEKSIRSHRVWAIKLRMDDGSERTLKQNSAPAWRAGDPVRIVDGRVASR